MGLKIEFVETALGNRIMDALKQRGWKLTQQYSPLAFDKGIDFDSYTFKNREQKLHFEWTNWFEWEVTGTSPTPEDLARAYGLNLKPADDPLRLTPDRS